MKLKILTVVASVLFAATAANATVEISKKPTSNMTCSGGVCTPTAKDAVLNVSDLATMLSGGDVTIQSASIAPDIVVKAALSWTSANRLTFDAHRSVEIDKPVTATGTGAITITTNDGGSNGDLSFVGKGNVAFWDLNSSLVINGNSYVLVGDIATLAADIADNPSGFYALAKDYDATADGTYTAPPINSALTGTVEGLGHVFSKVAMHTMASDSNGLFEDVWIGGVVRDLGVVDSKLEAANFEAAALLSGGNSGLISRCWATGSIHTSGTGSVGALVGHNGGTIVDSHVNANVHGRSPKGEDIGGLVGVSDGGTIETSYALGTVKVAKQFAPNVGGLVGENRGIIENSFARNAVVSARGNGGGGLGGLVGLNTSAGQISNSYAAGPITIISDIVAGGLIGFDGAQAGSISNSYWDLDMGIGNSSQGAGNVPNDPGITGLTTQQLQAGLPAGFDSKVWAIDPNKNQGFPYLKDVPTK